MKLAIDIPADMTPMQRVMFEDDVTRWAKEWLRAWGSPVCRLMFNEHTGKYEQRWCP